MARLRVACHQTMSIRRMSKAVKDRRKQAVKRRNPIARVLRDAAYRARKEANRRRYSRKAKHKPAAEPEPS